MVPILFGRGQFMGEPQGSLFLQPKYTTWRTKGTATVTGKLVSNENIYRKISFTGHDNFARSIQVNKFLMRAVSRHR
ncbi:hypothetical protein J6590_024195 [Homalodisca vitripennis]|nr:hypothetical protein J6590_024195 [Homalodisca vitripennis]